MEIFYNQSRPNYEEISSYGPKWWTEYREMDANYKFAGWTLDLMAYHLEKLIKNQFPMLADEKTIGILEKLLCIESDTSIPLDERRRIVMMYYSGNGHLSRSLIQQMIRIYVGCESEIFWDGLTFQIKIIGEEGPQFINEKILKFISRRMPAHISYGVSVQETIRQMDHVGIRHVLIPNMVISCEKLNFKFIHEHVGMQHVIVPNVVLT